MTIKNTSQPVPVPFPRTFYVANGVELLERLAYYGMYIGLSNYLTDTVKFSDVESSQVIGNFGFIASLAPVPCGMIADRIQFKRSLLISFSLYAASYLALFAYPTRGLTLLSLLCIAIGGGFMKPVISGTVVRTAPPGRESEGFAIFYRMVNAGAVVGKSLAYVVRNHFGLRFTLLNSMVGAVAALFTSAAAYDEPPQGKAPATPVRETFAVFGKALLNPRLTLALVVFAGFYFMSDQFYQTFPKYMTRHIDPKAPLEIITLVNPLTIAIFGVVVNRLTRNLHPMVAMMLGTCIGSLAMLTMGVVPGIEGALLSGAMYAVAEMVFSPRFYAFIGSFAGPGQAGMFIGLALVPMALGRWVAGFVSGPLIAQDLATDAPHHVFHIWSTFAMYGLASAVLIAIYGLWMQENAPKV